SPPATGAGSWPCWMPCCWPMPSPMPATRPGKPRCCCCWAPAPNRGRLATRRSCWPPSTACWPRAWILMSRTTRARRPCTWRPCTVCRGWCGGCCARAPTARPGTPWAAARMTWQCCAASSTWRPNSSPAGPAGRPPWHGSCAIPAEGGPGGRPGGLSRPRSELRIPLDQRPNPGARPCLTAEGRPKERYALVVDWFPFLRGGDAPGTHRAFGRPAWPWAIGDAEQLEGGKAAMNSRRKAYGAGKGSKRSNGLRVAPVTKAVRTALAFSALALATASPAFACDIVAPIPGDIVTCDDANYPGTIEYNVDDLTVVIGDGIGSTDVTPPSGDDGVELSGDGHLVVEVTSSASIYVENADGVDIESYGSAEATNAGLIDVENGTGISVEAYYDANVVNSGHIDADGAYFNAGIRAYSAYGSADVVNHGSIASYSSNSAAVGIIAYADVGATVVNNSAVDVYAYGYAAGILAYSWDGTASIENAGDVTVVSNSYGSAVGVGAAGSEVSIFNTGGVESVAFYGNAVGIEGYSTGNAVVDNEDYVYAGAYFDATAIDVYSLGDTTI